jgi:hypothetical protein
MSDQSFAQSMSPNLLSASVVTRACATNELQRCWGYVDPITNGDGIACQHIGHENGTGNVRDYSRALEAARKIADTMTGSSGQTRKGQPL